MKAADLFKTTRDDAGHLHDTDGKFTSDGDSDAGKQRAEAKKLTKDWLKHPATLTEKSGVKDKDNDYKTMLEQGQHFEHAEIPKHHLKHVGPMGLCFMNAMKMALAHPDKYRYAEGYAHSGFFPVHHAWVVDKDDRALDPTWHQKNEREPGLAYYGVPMDAEEAVKKMLEHGTYGYFLKEPKSKRKKSRKVQSASDLLKEAPDIEKVIDALGFAHDQRGRFAPKHASTAGVAEHVLHNTTGKPHAIFLSGGSGSGKGAIRASYTGGEVKRGPERINPKTGKKQPSRNVKLGALPGFDPSRVIDPDEHKKYPVESRKKGDAPKWVQEHPDLKDIRVEPHHYGPSGPTNKNELAEYPTEVRHAMLEHLKEHGFKSFEDFGKEVSGDPEVYGGGFTHELSSIKAKRQFQQLVHDPKGGSIVYDMVGNWEKYRTMAEQALQNGFAVTFHHVDTPRALARERNAQRVRSVAESVLNDAHKKAGDAAEHLRQVAKYFRPKKNQPVYFMGRKLYTEPQLNQALKEGWTDQGHVPMHER